MNALVLHPAVGPLRGTPPLPGDKSVSHRALFLAAWAEGPWTVKGLSPAEDVSRTAQALSALGLSLDRDGHVTRVTGGLESLRPRQILDCGNSGTTARLLLGFLAGWSTRQTLTGDASLMTRPMGRVIGPLGAWGLQVEEARERLPLAVTARPLPATLELEMPVASAQVKTALALAVMKAGGHLSLTEPHPSRDHTERLLESLDAPLRRTARGFRLRGPWRPPAHEMDIPGDCSAAAFWGVAATLVPGSWITMEGVGLNPGRTGWMTVLERMGGKLGVREVRGHDPVGTLEIRASQSLKPVTVEGAEVVRCLDEIPILSLAMARAEGISVIKGATELRIKESDRLSAIVDLLANLGIHARLSGDDLEIHGRGATEPLRPVEGALPTRKDHRMAMTAGIASLLCSAPVTLADASCAAVSDPRFWDTRRAIMQS
ncbi:MAG: 3-phosphoshikimate 1-carboxyvinyltransferase [Candidatus Sericytochromatia bacterium]|nr:3-phosphoshikimate 1-carboxyvinyltransferase [Candidatus Sericytochromatia bacterium]